MLLPEVLQVGKFSPVALAQTIWSSIRGVLFKASIAFASSYVFGNVVRLSLSKFGKSKSLIP